MFKSCNIFLNQVDFNLPPLLYWFEMTHGVFNCITTLKHYQLHLQILQLRLLRESLYKAVYNIAFIYFVPFLILVVCKFYKYYFKFFSFFDIINYTFCTIKNDLKCDSIEILLIIKK